MNKKTKKSRIIEKMLPIEIFNQNCQKSLYENFQRNSQRNCWKNDSNEVVKELSIKISARIPNEMPEGSIQRISWENFGRGITKKKEKSEFLRFLRQCRRNF